MTASEIRQKYFDFLQSKGHTLVPSASLVPKDDPTTLFTSAGMQAMIPYLTGQSNPYGTRVANSQKCFRSQDIEEVGDNRHTTFFEMLGNWSFGDYFKQEQLSWFFAFLTDEVGLDPQKLYVTVFAGNDQIPRDEESAQIWQKLFAEKNIEARTAEDAEQKGIQDARIFFYGEEKNWWSRAGKPAQMPAGELGGPDSEVFYEFSHIEHDQRYGAVCHVNCDCGRYMEIGNSVFMEYQKQEDDTFAKLAQRNVDFGGGLERITAASIDNPDVFAIDIFQNLIKKIEVISDGSYTDTTSRNMRIIADHIRAATMLIADGIAPSNKTQGYVVRRLLRRAIRYGNLLGIQGYFLTDLAREVITVYAQQSSQDFASLSTQEDQILEQIQQEEEKFAKTINQGLKEISKVEILDGTIAFKLYETYGFPFELTEEIARERGQHVEYGEFRSAFEQHQQQSRTTSAGLFKGGLGGHSDIEIRYHTATHLMHKALRQVLGEHVQQRGSNITPERTRFDFSHTEKMTPEQITKVENLVNQWIQEDLQVSREMMPLAEAQQIGALGAFGEKYTDPASVYTITNPKTGEIVSREFCGGPHVTHTGEIGHFTIVKEEAVSAGVRRIRAGIE
jgi:alanyl-tRNA synthetase